jgi:hypothetical protein
MTSVALASVAHAKRFQRGGPQALFLAIDVQRFGKHQLVQFGIFLHITAAATTTTFTVQVRFCTLQWDLFRLLTTSSQKIDRIRMREKKSTLVTRVHVSHPRVRLPSVAPRPIALKGRRDEEWVLRALVQLHFLSGG